MTKSKLALLVLKDTIEGFEQEQQNKIKSYVERFREIIQESKDSDVEDEETICQMAVSIVGLEMAVEMGQ